MASKSGRSFENFRNFEFLLRWLHTMKIVFPFYTHLVYIHFLPSIYSNLHLRCYSYDLLFLLFGWLFLFLFLSLYFAFPSFQYLTQPVAHVFMYFFIFIKFLAVNLGTLCQKRYISCIHVSRVRLACTLAQNSKNYICYDLQAWYGMISFHGRSPCITHTSNHLYPAYKWHEPYFKVTLITSNTHQTTSSHYFT